MDNQATNNNDQIILAFKTSISNEVIALKKQQKIQEEKIAQEAKKTQEIFELYARLISGLGDSFSTVSGNGNSQDDHLYLHITTKEKYKYPLLLITKDIPLS